MKRKLIDALDLATVIIDKYKDVEFYCVEHKGILSICESKLSDRFVPREMVDSFLRVQLRDILEIIEERTKEVGVGLANYEDSLEITPDGDKEKLNEIIKFGRATINELNKFKNVIIQYNLLQNNKKEVRHSSHD